MKTKKYVVEYVLDGKKRLAERDTKDEANKFRAKMAVIANATSLKTTVYDVEGATYTAMETY